MLLPAFADSSGQHVQTPGISTCRLPRRKLLIIRKTGNIYPDWCWEPMVIGLVNGHILFAIYPNIYPNIYPESLSLLLENFWQLVKKVYVGVYVAKHIPFSNHDNHRGLQPFRVYVRLILVSVLLCPNGQERLWITKDESLRYERRKTKYERRKTKIAKQ